MLQKWTKKFANVGATMVHHLISAVTRCQRQLIKKRHMINRHVSKMDREICKCGGNYGPPFHQCRDTLQRQLIKKRHMINRHVSKMDKEICKCGGNYGPPFDQCRDTLPAATYKETAYDQSSCFKNGQRNLQMWGQLRSTIPSVP